MKIVMKKDLGISELAHDTLSLDFFKKAVEEELLKINALDSLIDKKLDDEEYKNKMLSVYEFKYNDFSEVNEKEMIYTKIPCSISFSKEPIWCYRAYQVPKDFNNLFSCSNMDEYDLSRLVKNGLVLLDVKPYDRVEYKKYFEERNDDANKIPVLSTMDENDNKYDKYVIKALKDYDKEKLIEDRNKLLHNLKNKLEFIKRTNETAIYVMEEKLDIEYELNSYCNDKLDIIKRK